MDHTQYVVFSGRMVNFANPEGHNQYTGQQGISRSVEAARLSAKAGKTHGEKANKATDLANEANRASQTGDHDKAAILHQEAAKLHSKLADSHDDLANRYAPKANEAASNAHAAAAAVHSQLMRQEKQAATEQVEKYQREHPSSFANPEGHNQYTGKLSKLSPHEEVALVRHHLGGVEAMRTPDYHVDSKTVGSLMKKGIFDKQGLTPKGHAQVAKLKEKYGSNLPMRPEHVKPEPNRTRAGGRNDTYMSNPEGHNQYTSDGDSKASKMHQEIHAAAQKLETVGYAIDADNLRRSADCYKKSGDTGMLERTHHNAGQLLDWRGVNDPAKTQKDRSRI